MKPYQLTISLLACGAAGSYLLTIFLFGCGAVGSELFRAALPIAVDLAADKIREVAHGRGEQGGQLGCYPIDEDIEADAVWAVCGEAESMQAVWQLGGKTLLRAADERGQTVKNAEEAICYPMDDYPTWFLCRAEVE